MLAAALSHLQYNSEPCSCAEGVMSVAANLVLDMQCHLDRLITPPATTTQISSSAPSAAAQKVCTGPQANS